MLKAKILRNLISEKGLLVVPGAYDALSAKIVQHLKFQAVYMTGYGTAAAYGYPDYGLLTMTEMLENVRRICDAVNIPLIADADAGYGNPINVYRTVREYEKAGAVGIQLEDQKYPKRCGYMEGKQVIAPEEMVGKIKAAVDARTISETVLIIRTDAIATHGFDEAIKRGEMYAEAGADVLFIEAPNADQLRRIPACLSLRCLINVASQSEARAFDVETLEKMGYAIAIFPAVTLYGMMEGTFRICKKLREEGMLKTSLETPFDFEGLNQFLGVDSYRALELKFGSAQESLIKGETEWKR